MISKALLRLPADALRSDPTFADRLRVMSLLGAA